MTEHRRATWRKARKVYYWKHKEQEHDRFKKWRLANPENQRVRNLKWRNKHPDYFKKEHDPKKYAKKLAGNRIWEQKNKKRKNEYNQKWLRETGKNVIYHANRRKKGFIPLAPNIWDCPVDWHHLAPNQPYVVSVPREIHRTIHGKNHFIYNASMICQLYNLNLNEEDNLCLA